MTTYTVNGLKVTSYSWKEYQQVKKEKYEKGKN